MTAKEKFEELIKKYNSSDADKIKATVDMLCSKGIGNGCYQDYVLLTDVISFLCLFESAVREKDQTKGTAQ